MIRSQTLMLHNGQTGIHYKWPSACNPGASLCAIFKILKHERDLITIVDVKFVSVLHTKLL